MGEDAFIQQCVEFVVSGAAPGTPLCAFLGTPLIQFLTIPEGRGKGEGGGGKGDVRRDGGGAAI